ncbi:MAG: hypothetical protein E6662_16685 [Pantoea sp.]|nr:hypothetical protein [Pantoea sp.]
MSDSFRQLTEADTAAYYALVHAAYASARDLGIKFDAATADAAQMQRHIAAHGVYGMFRDSELVASVTLRYPWGPKKTSAKATSPFTCKKTFIHSTPAKRGCR